MTHDHSSAQRGVIIRESSNSGRSAHRNMEVSVSFIRFAKSEPDTMDRLSFDHQNLVFANEVRWPDPKPALGV